MASAEGDSVDETELCMDSPIDVQLTDFDAASHPIQMRLGAMPVVSEDPKLRALFDGCHNTTGHHGMQRTLNEIRAMEYEWPRMSGKIFK